jgi:hypothetical protein
MRPVHLFAALLLSVPALILGGFIALEGTEAPDDTNVSAPEALPQRNDTELLARLDALTTQVADLSMQVAELRTTREAAWAPQSLTPESGAPAATPATLSLIQRAAVVDVIEAERERAVEERRAIVEQKELQKIYDRASKVATRASLSPADEKLYAGVLVEERERRGQLKLDSKGQGGGRVTKELLKAGEAEIKAWREARVDQLLGYATAQSIRDLGKDRTDRRPRDESATKRDRKRSSKRTDGS